MPLSYRYDAGLDTVFVSITGKIADGELMEAGRRLAADPSVPPGRRELVDVTGFESHDVSAAAMREIAAAFGSYDQTPERVRVAFVAPSDWAFGLARMYQAYRDDSPVQLRVFRDLKSARAWLGLPEE